MEGITTAPRDFDDPRVVTKSITLVLNNTTGSVNLFTITGSVNIKKLYGIVTTAIGANHTNAFFRLNDSTTTVVLTLDGATLNAFPVGSRIGRKGVAAAAAVATSAAVGAMIEPASAGIGLDTEMTLIKKATGVTTIEYRYKTTDTPTTGAIKFYCEWHPHSDDGNVVAA
jgi:hypothetical protein